MSLPGLQGYVAFPPVTPDIFGPIVSAGEVADAMETTLQTWSATYIAEMAARTGLNQMQPFGSWEAVYEYRALPADLSAACWVLVPTTDPRRTPAKQGDGTYRAVFIAQVNLVVFGTDWRSSRDLVYAYAAAVNAAVLQHGSLGGFASNTRWLGGSTKEIDHQRVRTIQAATLGYAVTVENVVDTNTGPASSVPPGTSSGPTVETVNVQVDDYPVDLGLPKTRTTTAAAASTSTATAIPTVEE
jgi:hypothetical protein